MTRARRRAIADGLRRHPELEAALFQRRLRSSAAAGRVELTLHQRVGDVHDGHVHALLQQAVGCFETQQAAADHDRLAVGARRLQHGVDVMQVAERDDAGQVVARNRQHESDSSRWRAAGDRTAASTPLRERTTRRRRSIATTGSPACSVMPCSRYHSSGLMMMSATCLLAGQHAATAGCGCSCGAARRRTR